MKEWYSENGLKMNSNKTQCILFAKPNFNTRTETFKITIDDTELLLLLLEKVDSARLRESGIHPISPKTPVPQYQPIDRKKRKGKKVEDYSRDRAS